jgi:serine/threonine-protein kinase HipA
MLTYSYVMHAKVRKMAVYLVGENIDKTRSHYLSDTGKLTQLMRGVYADTTDDIDATILKHAVRIAKYLYPNTYLAAASAILLAPTSDGRLFLSGRRRQRTRLRALEIIQTDAPPHPSVASAIVDDGMGEFRVDVSSIRQRFLESFRTRSEQAASIDEKMRDVLEDRLLEEYGDTKSAADAVWALARENEWYKEGEQSERFLLRNPLSVPARNEAALNLVIAWHGERIGNLTHDGFEWRWTPASSEGPFLVRQTTPGRLPPFIISLLPEGWLEHVLQARDERAMLKSGKRYMSNVTIVDDQRDLATLPSDVLATPLGAFSEKGVFTGKYVGPGRSEIEESFERNLAQIYEHQDTPRLSGIQIKAPMYLDPDGTLSPSIGTPFTHILKPAGTSGFESLPVIEWMSLMLGKAIGFEVPAVALVTMPGKMPPALLVERFDIRNSESDRRRFALEDLCSVLNLPTEAKYDGTIERVARAVRSLSTSPDDDVQLVFRRALFAWLIADGDMHLKNMAMLKISEPEETRFSSVRMAPLYDAVTTRVFPRLERDRMALKLNGKDDHLRRADFRILATTAGMRSSDADRIIDSTIGSLKDAIDHFAAPESIILSKEAGAMATRMLGICRERSNGFD